MRQISKFKRLVRRTHMATRWSNNGHVVQFVMSFIATEKTLCCQVPETHNNILNNPVQREWKVQVTGNLQKQAQANIFLEEHVFTVFTRKFLQPKSEYFSILGVFYWSLISQSRTKFTKCSAIRNENPARWGRGSGRRRSAKVLAVHACTGEVVVPVVVAY